MCRKRNVFQDALSSYFKILSMSLSTTHEEARNIVCSYYDICWKELEFMVNEYRTKPMSKRVYAG
jgi:hypothetical protein